jgi:hypothetical protein
MRADDVAVQFFGNSEDVLLAMVGRQRWRGGIMEVTARAASHPAGRVDRLHRRVCRVRIRSERAGRSHVADPD